MARSDGNPIAATIRPIHAYRWNGAAWDLLGDIAATGRTPALAMQVANAFLVTWSAGTSAEVFVSRWNGTAWESLGGSDTGGGVSNTPTRSSVTPSIAAEGP